MINSFVNIWVMVKVTQCVFLPAKKPEATTSDDSNSLSIGRDSRYIFRNVRSLYFMFASAFIHRLMCLLVYYEF